MSWFDTLPRADAAYGFPPGVALAFSQAASEVGAAIISRAPGGATTQLIQERYDLKGFFIKGKSCDWGPMAGFVCMNPLFNKNGVDGATFNAAMHRDYLTTLFVMGQQELSNVTVSPSAHPDLGGHVPTDDDFASVIARAGRPLWISDTQEGRLVPGGAMLATLFTAIPGQQGDDSAVGIALDSRTAPTVAVEVLLRRDPARSIWALYAGGTYQRAFGSVGADSTVIGSTADATRIVLDRDEAPAFPSNGDFDVLLFDPAHTDTVELVTVTRADNVLTVSAGGRGRLDTDPLATIAEGWTVQSGWLAGSTDTLLSNVLGADGVTPRPEFATAYPDEVPPVLLSQAEQDAVGALRTTWTGAYVTNRLDAPAFQSLGVRMTPVIGMQNPFPPRVADKAYLNAVTGDYDLAAVWPGTPTRGMRRISELRWDPANPPLPAPDDWWLEVGMPVFLPVEGKPFAVELARVRGLIVEFVPTGDQLTDEHLESDSWGNANSLVLDVVQRLNSFTAAQYAADDSTGAVSQRTGRTLVNPPNVAFHSDEGGRPDINKIDFAFAGFLPRQWRTSLGNPLGDFVFDKLDAQPESLDHFLIAMKLLAPLSSVAIQSGWLSHLLKDDARGDEVSWFFITGTPGLPVATDPRVANLTPRIPALRAALRVACAIPAGAPPPSARDRAVAALALRV